MSEKVALSLEQIHELLPHRYPMLLVDRVLEISDQGVVAEKLVSTNDPFLQGHFPGKPIMPGVLILEAMAQTAGLGIYWNLPQHRGKGVALAGIDRVRFRRPVVPGDILTLNVIFTRRRGRVMKAKGVASVQGEAAAEADFMAAIVDWEKIS